MLVFLVIPTQSGIFVKIVVKTGNFVLHPETSHATKIYAYYHQDKLFEYDLMLNELDKSCHEPKMLKKKYKVEFVKNKKSKTCASKRQKRISETISSQPFLKKSKS